MCQQVEEWTRCFGLTWVFQGKNQYFQPSKSCLGLYVKKYGNTCFQNVLKWYLVVVKKVPAMLKLVSLIRSSPAGRKSKLLFLCCMLSTLNCCLHFFSGNQLMGAMSHSFIFLLLKVTFHQCSTARLCQGKNLIQYHKIIINKSQTSHKGTPMEPEQVSAKEKCLLLGG